MGSALTRAFKTWCGASGCRSKRCCLILLGEKSTAGKLIPLPSTTSLDELQADLDEWLVYYNEERPHSGRYCYGKRPLQTWRDSKPLVEEKMLECRHQPPVVNYHEEAAVA